MYIYEYGTIESSNGHDKVNKQIFLKIGQKKTENFICHRDLYYRSWEKLKENFTEMIMEKML